MLGVLSSIFWGLILLSVLVFVHEGGHFLAARICGVRVREFFIGMPCRFNLHHVSKRIGTTFGVTPILLGGYAAISGMDPTPSALAEALLYLVHQKGTIMFTDACHELSASEDDVMQAVTLLQDWGSIICEETTQVKNASNEHEACLIFKAPPRDQKGYTTLDGRKFSRGKATEAGQPWETSLKASEFYAFERSRTYVGQGFFKRSFMLLAGIAVNIVTGFLLVIVVYSVLGISAPVNSNVLGAVENNSPAQQAGLAAGDKIVRVDETDVASWTDLISSLQTYGANDTVHVEYEDVNNNQRTTEVTLDSEGKLGVIASMQTVRLHPLESCSIALKNIELTAQSVSNLINPQHTKEVLDNSTSIVGISVMSAQAAAAGPSTFLNFAAIISFSLAFMNLLPIPPLDGGKFLIEIIQAILRREISMKVQTIISIIGVALFGLLFIYMLGVDILRFI